MFILGKLVWLVAAPGSFLTLMLVAGVLALILTRRRHGLSLVVLSTLGFLAVIFLPVGDWAVAPLENRFPVPAPPPERVDGIVVLGGAVDEVVSAARGTVKLNESGTRMTDAVMLARRYPSSRIVLTGGDSSVLESAPAEAGVMQQFFLAEGIDAARITLESKSRTTFENAVLSQALVQPKPGETWLLVTSAAHMPRAVGCFRRAGWEVVPYPVDFRTTGTGTHHTEFSLANHLELLTKAAREWIGLVGYRLAGRIDDLFPAPR
jgi:uncharacterized SAM-binding protein YcdF (DUF218 family)